MSETLIAFSGVLAGVNLFAVVIVAVTIDEIYNINSIYYNCIASTLCLVITLVNVEALALFKSFGHAGLALLIQIGILTACILAIKMILKDDYKRNVKPYLQIKI